MDYELIGITVLWTFLYGYLIVASIDFGAGFFSYYSSITGREHIINKVIARYLSPVWEVTNVFLVFFFIGIVGFFPSTAYYYGTALLIPGSIAIILLAIRGSYYAFHNYGEKGSLFYQFLYGATGLLIPASLSVVLTISEGGFIILEGDQVLLDYPALFSSFYSWTVVILAIVSVLYISACFLTFYAYKARDIDAFKVLRGYALFWSFPTILASILVFFALNQHNPVHFEKMVDLAWMFSLSFLFFLGAVYLIWKGKRLGLSFIFVMLQFATAFYGYGASHLPYLLYPHLTIYDGFTNEAMAIALIIAFIAGLFLLIPSLYLLMRLFLFDNKYVQGRK
ncbi:MULTISPECIES: cytochrome d ubiquinol oxidase subunit II [Alkalihalophilus]|uniref:Cytochrome d ubiquinol oxidase subunit II n=1 Tax=Alkalihalophilus pseudofirmus (strain ATCC BAA-2126 / JCM 17055 / OF4) TaxID=398511 RepID=D3FSF0_ALKPO|nr:MULTISPECIES: cytochrome d ubiquinol oxidase subunit II [Alkalihalophilus]ADC49918.1 cytochrome d ubiquinol oxidase subunit II [Alkalihalophilus pseudofirmus OF4]MEC2071067.1 cytochrome d ubiquinol oxidase subunit II [Alkalihalophilus marmarensis]